MPLAHRRTTQIVSARGPRRPRIGISNVLPLLKTLGKESLRAFINHRKHKAEASKKRKTPHANSRPSRPSATGEQMSSHNDLSKHKMFIKYLGKKMNKLKTMGKFRYIDVRESVQSCPAGQQLVFDLPGIATRSQLTGTFTNNARAAIDNWPQSPFTLNPFYNQGVLSAGHPFYNPGVGVVSQDRISLSSADYELHMLNMENIPIEVEINWMTPKQDIGNTPTLEFQQAILSDSFGQPVEAPAAATATVLAAPGYASYVDYGNHPNKYRQFNKAWKSLGTYKIVLQPGDQHVINSKLVWHKILEKHNLDARSSVSHLRGLTIIPNVICKAGLAAIYQAPSTAATEVTWGPVKVGFVQKLAYKFDALPLARISTTRTFNGVVAPSAAYFAPVIDADDDLTIIKQD